MGDPSGRRAEARGERGDQLTPVIVNEREFADLVIAEIESWSEKEKAEARERLYQWADGLDAKGGTD